MNPTVSKSLESLRHDLARSMRRDPQLVVAKLEEIGNALSPSELRSVIPKLVGILGVHAGMYVVPDVVIQTVTELLEGREVDIACDPWAGLGVLASTIKHVTNAKTVFAFTANTDEGTFGKALVKNVEWRTGRPSSLLDQIETSFDAVTAVLPFGMKSNQSISLKTVTGETVELIDDYGHQILAAATRKLTKEGIGLFVVAPSFFFSHRSVLRQFETLGIGIEAALSLPPGSFAPYTNIDSYLIVVRNRPTTRMFIGQLTSDLKTNHQVIQNLKDEKEADSLDSGRFVDPLSFVGIDLIRAAERTHELAAKFDAPAIALEDLATEINLGRPGEEFMFPSNDNSLYVPLIGISDVIDSVSDLTLKPQNYAQIVIDPAKSESRFVARFLNSEFGKELREANKSGTTIFKLSKQTLKKLPIFVPSIQTQRQMLDVETRITVESVTLLGLQNEINELRRELWSNPQSIHSVREQIDLLSSRISGSLKQHAVERLDHWFDTLPFPLASILRAWQATTSDDYEKKCALLGKFFEATAEFVGVILLSAYSSNEPLFEPHRLKLKEVMAKGNVSLARATFGTWKVIIEYLGKQTRELLKDNPQKPEESKANRAICAELFGDPSLDLPTVLSNVELARIISTTNTLRNNAPTSHGGTPTQEEARALNESLVGELQKLREVMADTWNGVQMIHALHSRMRRDQFENEVELLMGSNNDFLKENRTMKICMDVERLYLSRKESGRALRLLPFIRVGPSPKSVKNTCYFFNKIVPEGVRFVCYHHGDQSELKGAFADAAEAISFLTGE